MKQTWQNTILRTDKQFLIKEIIVNVLGRKNKNREPTNHSWHEDPHAHCIAHPIGFRGTELQYNWSLEKSAGLFLSVCKSEDKQRTALSGLTKFWLPSTFDNPTGQAVLPFFFAQTQSFWKRIRAFSSSFSSNHRFQLHEPPPLFLFCIQLSDGSVSPKLFHHLMYSSEKFRS